MAKLSITYGGLKGVGEMKTSWPFLLSCLVSYTALPVLVLGIGESLFDQFVIVLVYLSNYIGNSWQNKDSKQMIPIFLLILMRYDFELHIINLKTIKRCTITWSLSVLAIHSLYTYCFIFCSHIHWDLWVYQQNVVIYQQEKQFLKTNIYPGNAMVSGRFKVMMP